MITLSPITRSAISPCYQSKFTDRTDYGQSLASGFTLADFENGVRLVRVVAPSGEVTIYSFADNIPISLVPDFLPVTDLQCQITGLNYTQYDFTIPVISGDYEIDILSIPLYSGVDNDYVDGDMMMRVISGNRVLFIKDAGVFSPLFTDVDFTGVTESYINRAYFTIDCSLWANVKCIFSNYETAFCGKCGCGDVCKNRKSNSIMKATMILRELELLETNQFEYQKKLELYTPVIKKLCQCS